MIVNKSIEFGKKIRNKGNNSIIPIRIHGEVLDISPIQRDNNKSFIVVEISDKTDIANVQIWGNNNNDFKINFVVSNFNKGDKLIIAEPRCPNKTWLQKGIDFWVNSLFPPVGTDISGFMDWYNSNIKKKRNNHLMFQTADQMVKKSNFSSRFLNTISETIQKFTSNKNENFDEIKFENYEIILGNLNKFKNIGPEEWCTIWIYDQKPENIFIGYAKIYGKSEDMEWVNLIKIKSKNNLDYNNLKSKINLFHDFKLLKKIVLLHS